MKRSAPLLVLLFLFALGCSSDTPSGPVIATPADINAIVRDAGRIVPTEADRDSIVSTSMSDEGDYRYIYETHDVVDNIENIAYLGLNDDIVWPGNVVKGDKVESFVYNPIILPRAPITLSVSLETSSTGDSITQLVNDPKLSTVRQGISNLLKTAITGDTYVPAKVEFYHEQVFSQSQMNLFVGADVSYGVGSLDTAFDWSSTEQKTKIVAKYKQIYYSIDMDYPQQPVDLFVPGLTVDEVRTAIPPGSRPVYVAGVSYGMMALMTIETSFSAEEMNAALEAACNGLVDFQITSQYTAQEVMERSTVRIVVYGGSTLGLQHIEEDFTGFMKVVKASTEFNNQSPGVPLVYKFRHLADNTLAAVTLTSQYTLVRPLQLRQRIRVTVDKFQCTMADDEGVNNNPDMDRFQVTASAYERTTETAPEEPITEDQTVYSFVDANGGITMGRGYIWLCSEPNSIDIPFDTENHDFDLARLHLWVWARDYDPSSANENGYATLDIDGYRFLENNGVHTWLVGSSDFRFKVYVTLKLLD